VLVLVLGPVGKVCGRVGTQYCAVDRWICRAESGDALGDQATKLLSVSALSA